MKKIILIIIIFCFNLSVYALSSEEKLERIALFSRNFIIEGMSGNHLDDKGMPILNYNRGIARVEGYNDILSFVSNDYHEKIGINKNKWNFDCSSFVSYIFKKTINLKLLSTNYRGGNPYLVSDFVNDKLNFDEVTSRKGINMTNLIKLKDYLKTLDLIIVEGKHIAIYLGNNELVEASQTLIGKYDNKYIGYHGDGAYNLGFGITSFDNFLANKSEEKFIVLRIKEDIINNISNINTSIIWPDTNVNQNLVLDNETQLNIVSNTLEYTNKLSLNLKFLDKDGLKEYKIERDDINSDYIKIKNYEYELTYDILENGKYTIFVQDFLGNIVTKTLQINNIDKKKPIINNLDYRNGLINIEANDLESGLAEIPYSIDDCKTWTDKNIIGVKENGQYVVCVKDKAGNITKDTLSVKIEKVISNNDNKTKNNNGIYILFFVIYTIVIAILLVLFMIKKKIGDNNV